jgi:hypothetical protein
MHTHPGRQTGTTSLCGITAQAVPLADAPATTPRPPSCLPAHVTLTRATHTAPRLPPHLDSNAPNGLATITTPTAAGHHTDHTRQARRLHEALQASPAPGPECRVTCSEAPSCWPRLPTHHGLGASRQQQANMPKPHRPCTSHTGHTTRRQSASPATPLEARPLLPWPLHACHASLTHRRLQPPSIRRKGGGR